MSKTQSFLEIRFNDRMLEARNRLWNVLCTDFFQQFIQPDNTVLDMGAGYCEFINNIKCKKKYAMDIDASPMQYANKEVKILIGESLQASKLLNGEKVDVVFLSNFLEHISTKEELVRTLKEIKMILSIGGKLLIPQPNIRYCYKQYWDFFDHHIPLSHKSLEEVLRAVDFKIIMIKPKFLPFSTKSCLPLYPRLVKLYLRISLAQFMIGKHDPVPVNLGQNRGSRNTPADLISLFQAPLGEGQGDLLNTVNEKELRLWVQGQDSPFHGLERCIQDIEFIKIFVGDNPYACGKGLALDNRKGLIPGL